MQKRKKAEDVEEKQRKKRMTGRNSKTREAVTRRGTVHHPAVVPDQHLSGLCTHDHAVMTM